MQVGTIGLDIAKGVFQVRGVAAGGGVAIRKKLSRSADLIKARRPIAPHNKAGHMTAPDQKPHRDRIFPRVGGAAHT